MKLFWLKTPFTWIASLSEFEDIHPKAKIIKRVKPEVRSLCAYLLGIGGDRVIVPLNEDMGFCKALVDIGKITPYKRLRTKSGEERECHRNTASLWLSNKTKYRIATGFGLSNDHTWRSHSWIITTDGDLIETTIARDVYFGIILTNKIARAFAESYA